MNPPPLDQVAGLLCAIRRARRAFLASGRPPGHWDSLADGVRRDVAGGADLRQTTRMVTAWAELLARPEPADLHKR